MECNDTEKLLRECDAGAKMGVTSIDEILESVCDEKLKGLLQESKEHHAELGNEIHEQLRLHNTEEKDPNIMAKGMSWMKTNMKLTMDCSDATVADLLTDGCDMGTKSLHKYLNQYKAADEKSRRLCQKLIDIEETLRKDLRDYL
ncbi:MAG: hypothetical protein E7285_08795 [Lachnospiraceae bacterium]|nr:hypothetical protein [Lachnospiraceae bacterium]